MKGKHCLLLLLILGALLACNDPKPVTDALHRAEALMNEHPDIYNEIEEKVKEKIRRW
jgi:hypothetical protein